MRVCMLVMNDMTSDARVDREASALVEAGHDVVVLATSADGLPATEDRAGYRIQRVIEPSQGSWSHPLAKVLQMRARNDRVVSAVTSPIDCVHSEDADTFVPGMRISAATGATFVADAGELYSEMLKSNRKSVPPFVNMYWDAVEKRGIREAQAAITVGDAIADEMGRRYGRRPEVLLNVPPLAPRGDRRRLRSAMAVPDGDFVVLYQGLINIGRGLISFVDCLPSLEGVHLALQGRGPLLEQLLSQAAKLGVSERVHYLGHVPVQELHDWASGADAGLLILEDTSLNNALAAPNKLFQYMMAGIPTLASRLPGMQSIIDEIGCGVLVDVGDPADIIAGVRGLAEAPEGRMQMGERGRSAAERKYNWDIEKRKLIELYERLATSSTS